MHKVVVGIIGCGFVGNAVKQAFEHTIVSDPAINDVSVADIVDAKPDAIFICVPTPQGDDGNVDGSIVRSVIDQIPEGRLTIVKSTITPSWLPIGKRGLVYNPEFLTHAHAEEAKRLMFTRQLLRISAVRLLNARLTLQT